VELMQIDSVLGGNARMWATWNFTALSRRGTQAESAGPKDLTPEPTKRSGAQLELQARE
jgi:hypothetical protein